MIGKKLLINLGKTKDVVVIQKVLYTNSEGKYSLECKSLCTNTKVNLIMTVDEVKNSLIK